MKKLIIYAVIALLAYGAYKFIAGSPAPTPTETVAPADTTKADTTAKVIDSLNKVK